MRLRFCAFLTPSSVVVVLVFAVCWYKTPIFSRCAVKLQESSKRATCSHSLRKVVHHNVHSCMQQPLRSLLNANAPFRYRTGTLRMSQINHSNSKTTTPFKSLVYAPSLPNSFVHSAFLDRSSPLTVGLLPLIAFTKSRTLRGGSRSSSPSSSVQDFSTACGSPGEQGVHFCAPSTCTCSNHQQGRTRGRM